MLNFRLYIWIELSKVLNAKTVAQSLTVLSLSNVPWVSSSMMATFSPSSKVALNTSDHIRIPVVSLSDPPRQVKPSNGLSSEPIQCASSFIRFK